MDYGGRQFGGQGAVGLYHQDGDLVWAEFSGAAVAAGRLVGRCRPDGVIDASYCYLTSAGDPVAGVCVSTPKVLPDGRLMLTENWRRIDGTVGISYVEEVAP